MRLRVVAEEAEEVAEEAEPPRSSLVRVQIRRRIR
jgi:hypothetical protein